MRGLFLRLGAKTNLDSAKLFCLRFRHAQLDSGLKSGWICSNNVPERRISADQRDGGIAEVRLGAHHRLHQKIGDVNASKSHNHSIQSAGTAMEVSIPCSPH